MVNCAVPSCKNDSRRQTKQNSNVTFHRFPKNEELLRKWVVALSRPDWEPTIRSFVCSAHFPESSMYFSKSGLRKLIQDAVPAVTLDNTEPQKQKREAKTKSSQIIMPYMYVSRSHSPEDTRKKRKSEFSLDNVKKERTNSTHLKKSKDSADPVNRKLKKRIMNLTKLSKRRRLRCNALYASLNRIRKKVSGMTGAIKDLQQKISENDELRRVMELYGASPQELFQAMGNKERFSPEPQEDDFFYSEIPSDIETFIESRATPKKQITTYTTSIPPRSSESSQPELDVDVPVVKTESSSPRREPEDAPEPVFVDMNAVCRVCLLSNVTMHTIEEDLRETYEKLAVTKMAERGGPGALCRGCRAGLQACQRFAELVHKAEHYHHTREAVIDGRDD